MEAKRSLPEDSQNKFLAELQRGEAASSQGNHGMARVCARRAVGWAVLAYYQQNEDDSPEPSSAIDAIRQMIDDVSTASDIRNKLMLFVQRPKKDSPEGDSYWPPDLDLIVEARIIIDQLYK